MSHFYFHDGKKLRKSSQALKYEQTCFVQLKTPTHMKRAKENKSYILNNKIRRVKIKIVIQYPVRVSQTCGWGVHDDSPNDPKGKMNLNIKL